MHGIYRSRRLITLHAAPAYRVLLCTTFSCRALGPCTATVVLWSRFYQSRTCFLREAPNCVLLVGPAMATVPTPAKHVIGTSTLIRLQKNARNVSCMTSDGRCVQDQLYSVRVRNRGPDYRTLVTADTTRSWKCYYESCRAAEETRLRSTPGTDSMSCCEH